MDPFEVSLSLDLSLLRVLRRELTSWLEAAGVAESARDSIVLATHEAAANAIEHAQLGSEVSVRGLRDDHELMVMVTNTGTWKKSRHDDDARGRGVALMKALMSEIDVRAESRRTTVTMRKQLS